MLKERDNDFYPFDPLGYDKDILFIEKEETDDEEAPEELTDEQKESNAYRQLITQLSNTRESDIISEDEHTLDERILRSDIRFCDLFNREEMAMEVEMEEFNNTTSILLNHFNHDYDGLYDTMRNFSRYYRDIPNVYIQEPQGYSRGYRYQEETTIGHNLMNQLIALDNVSDTLSSDDDDFI